MSLIIAISLLVVAILLFIVVKKGWISNETLQMIANVAGIVALLAAVAIFVLPQQPPHPKIPSPNSQGNSVSLNSADANEPSTGYSGPPENSFEYFYLNEEQVRTEISKSLEVDNIEKAIRLLRYLSSDIARDEESDHIFNYCLKNGHLDHAEKVLKFFKLPSKKEAAQKELALEKVKRQ